MKPWHPIYLNSKETELIHCIAPYFLGTLDLSADGSLLLCHDSFVDSALSFSLGRHGHCDGDKVILAINLHLLCQRLLLWAVSDLQIQTTAASDLSPAVPLWWESCWLNSKTSFGFVMKIHGKAGNSI